MIRRSQPTAAILALGLVCLGLAAAAGPAHGYTPDPQGLTYTVPIGGKDYLHVSQVPVMVPLVGEGTLYGYARCRFRPGETEPKKGVVEISGLPGDPAVIPMEFEPSTVSEFDDAREGVPSAGVRFEIPVPDGNWTAVLRGEVVTRRSQQEDEDEDVYVLLYYDGPPQARLRTGAGETRRQSPWSFRNEFGLELIYTDNILTQSDDAMDAFLLGVDADQFAIRSLGDIIVAPSLQLEARRRFFSLGQTRFRFKVKYWRYSWNPIKNNTDYDFYIRQYFGRRSSLEMYLHHAPEQYIRELNDLEPYSDDGYVARHFNFTRNVANLTWRQRLSRNFEGRLIVETNRRYYNQEFIENDIEAWELRGRLTWRARRWLDVDLSYSYEHAVARAVDTVGETPDDSNDGDASYNRDLYRIGVRMDTKWLEPVVEGLDVTYLFMDYYYPTERSIFDDPYHVGRRDKVTKVFVTLDKRLNRTLSIDAQFRYSERVVESPWYGDITLDKDYTERRYSIGLEQRF